MKSADADRKLQEMAARIREMREIIGYTVAHMAEVTGVSEKEYEDVEAARIDPTFNFLHQCAIAFGVDINALLEGHSAHLSGYEVTRAGQGPLTAHESHMDIRNQAAMFQNRLARPIGSRTSTTPRSWISQSPRRPTRARSSTSC